MTAAFLDGVNTAALALMAGVLIQLGQTTLHRSVDRCPGGVALAVLLRFKLNSAWLVLAGGLVGVGSTFWR